MKFISHEHPSSLKSSFEIELDISGILLAAFCEEVPIPSGPIQTDAQSLLKALAFAQAEAPSDVYGSMPYENQ